MDTYEMIAELDPVFLYDRPYRIGDGMRYTQGMAVNGMDEGIVPCPECNPHIQNTPGPMYLQEAVRKMLKEYRQTDIAAAVGLTSYALFKFINGQNVRSSTAKKFEVWFNNGCQVTGTRTRNITKWR